MQQFNQRFLSIMNLLWTSEPWHQSSLQSEKASWHIKWVIRGHWIVWLDFWQPVISSFMMTKWFLGTSVYCCNKEPTCPKSVLLVEVQIFTTWVMATAQMKTSEPIRSADVISHIYNVGKLRSPIHESGVK